MSSAAVVRISGPARNLRRVREQAATVEDVRGVFAARGRAHTLVATFKLQETRRRIRIVWSRGAWEEFEDRIHTACVFFVDRPIVEKEPLPAPALARRQRRSKPQVQPPLFEEPE